MRLGPLIRHSLGRYEHGFAEAYRRIFVDLDDFVARIRAWVPNPRRILEVGCGEGAVTERLVSAYPDATITATDITSATGRMFRGDSARVTFVREPVENIAHREPVSFDLVLLCDVVHHVPPTQHAALLAAIERAMAPGASFVFKDWTPSCHPIHWLCAFSDRYVTGDTVQFRTKPSLTDLLTGAFGAEALRAETVVRPWSNNVAFLIRP